MRCNRSPRKIALQPLLVALLFCLAPTALIQAQATPAEAAESGAGNVELQRQIQAYEKAIAESDGSYASASAELYLSLAESYGALGDNESAAEFYQERLQALRISLGLDSQEQLATLSAYNEVLFQLGDWQQIDSNFHLSHHIASKLYAREDPRFIESATALASWKIKAFENGLISDEDDRSIDDSSIQEAAQIYQELAEQLSEDDPAYHAKRSDYFSAKGLAHFYGAKYFANLPSEYFQASVSSAGGQQQCYSLVMSVDGAQPARSVCPETDIANTDVFTAQQRAKSETVRRHLSDMRASFVAAIESIENGPSPSPKQLALATLNLGDASLLAQDYGRANTQYRNVWEILSVDSASQNLRDALLSQPSPVMRGVLDELVIDQAVLKNKLAGSVSFDVARNGEIENIAIQGSEQAFEPDNIAAIAIKLDQTTYRPKIADGKPVRARITRNAADL